MTRLIVVIFIGLYCSYSYSQESTPAPESLELDWSEENPPAFLSACSFRAYVPAALIDKSKKVLRPRAILLIIPGYNGDARNINQQWKEFAEAEKVLIIGTQFTKGTQPYEIAPEMAKVLTKGIEQILKLAALQNDNIPLLLTGSSAGGNVILSFAVVNSSKIIALAISKSAGFANLHAGNPEPTYDIPTLFHIGGKDPIFQDRPINRYWDGRKNKALWTMLLDKEGGHESTPQAQELFRQFFSSLLEMRLGEVGTFNQFSNSKPAKIKISDGVLINPETLTEDGKTKKDESIWVPNHAKFRAAFEAQAKR